MPPMVPPALPAISAALSASFQMSGRMSGDSRIRRRTSFAGASDLDIAIAAVAPLLGRAEVGVVHR